MKKLIALFMLPLVASAGTGDIQVGACALEGANNTEWNTVAGGAAMYNAANSSFNVAVGHRAGENLRNGDNNVFIGVRAGKNMENYRNVVAIGEDTGRTNYVGRLTDINNHILVIDDETEVTSGKVHIGNNLTSLTYEDGLWTLNGSLKVLGNITIDGSYGVYSPIEQITLYEKDFDFVVDEVRGNDDDAGTMVYPFKTLNKAIEAANQGGYYDLRRICVRAGHYSYPSALMDEGVYGTYEFVAIDGKDKTFIESVGDDTPKYIDKPDRGEYASSFKGFTFNNFERFDSGEGNGWFSFLKFDDCNFHISTRIPSKNSSNGGCGFYQCVLNNCVVDGVILGANAFGGSLFKWCFLKDCKVTPIQDLVDTQVNLSEGTQFVNCYIVINNVQSAPTNTSNKPSWTDGNFYNTTLAVANYRYENINYSTQYFNCLLRGESVYGTTAGCYNTTFTSDNDNMATLFGYNAQPYNAIKNGLLDIVANALTTSLPSSASTETKNVINNAAAKILAKKGDDYSNIEIPEITYYTN